MPGIGPISASFLQGFLLTTSAVDPATRQAFLETHYLVHGDTPLTLQVGMASPSLKTLYRTLRVGSCAFITACNPWSRPLDAASNAKRQSTLALGLQQCCLTFVEGLGRHPSGQWPGEPSFLVWGLTLKAAKALGTEYEQIAIVWCGSDAVPQLISLR